jgi:hypothetical protein
MTLHISWKNKKVCYKFGFLKNLLLHCNMLLKLLPIYLLISIHIYYMATEDDYDVY